MIVAIQLKKVRFMIAEEKAGFLPLFCYLIAITFRFKNCS